MRSQKSHVHLYVQHQLEASENVRVSIFETTHGMYILGVRDMFFICVHALCMSLYLCARILYARSPPTTATGRAAAALHRIAKQLWCSIRAIDHVPLSESQSDVGRAERLEQASVTGLLDDCYAPLISTRPHQTNLTWTAD